MADMTTKKCLSVVATTSNKVKELPIVNGQLVFCQDKARVAFDFNDKRVFYSQITTLDTEIERLTIDEPTLGYYFVIDTAVLWFYNNEWIQITSKPESILFVGISLPELGQAKEGMLYVNKVDKEIAIFDSVANEYIVVSDKTQGVTIEDIENLFD